jgi:hypothetical protein
MMYMGGGSLREKCCYDEEEGTSPVEPHAFSHQITNGRKHIRKWKLHTCYGEILAPTWYAATAGYCREVRSSPSDHLEPDPSRTSLPNPPTQT